MTDCGLINLRTYSSVVEVFGPPSPRPSPGEGEAGGASSMFDVGCWMLLTGIDPPSPRPPPGEREAAGASSMLDVGCSMLRSRPEIGWYFGKRKTKYHESDSL